MDPQVLDEIVWKQLSNLPYFRGMLRAVEHSFYVELNLERPILDIGAGDGHFAEVVFADPLEVGLDPWLAPMLEAKDGQAYILLVQAAGNMIPYPEKSFASVISNSVLEHISDVQPVLQDIQRVLQPGGVFVFCVPNQRFLSDLWGQQIFLRLGLKKLAQHYNRFFNKVARHINLDGPEVWQQRLELAGFTVERYWHYFPVSAMHILERGHLFGLPNLLWKKTTGRWVLIRRRWNPFIPWRKVRNLLEVGELAEGTCTFYIARRTV